MYPTSGYYCLIQYCPDAARLEAANVGVVLFCPDVPFLGARTAPSNDRVSRFFGRDSIDPERLNAAKKALEDRLRVERASFRELADLEKFVRTRANELILTPPRPITVRAPERELGELFEELVGKRERKVKKASRLQTLDQVFHKLKLQGRARLNVRVEIPVLKRTVKFPYAYNNGVLNLVKPQQFSDEEERATKTAMELAIEGDLLSRHTVEEGRKAKLIVVSSFEPEEVPSGLRDRIHDVLEEYNVEPVPAERVKEFARKVEREAH
jgi:hypothetical protein